MFKGKIPIKIRECCFVLALGNLLHLNQNHGLRCFVAQICLLLINIVAFKSIDWRMWRQFTQANDMLEQLGSSGSKG